MANAIAEMCLTGNIAENWKMWKARFLNYLKASEINKKENSVQCALLLHFIGQEGYRIYTTFNLTPGEEILLNDLIKKFDDHFQPRQNITYERYKFFMARQQGSTIEKFITSLKEQANKCDFGNLKDSLTKCMLICGVSNNEIREKLLQNDQISLEETIKLCTVIEESREQCKKIQSSSRSDDAQIQFMTTSGTVPRRSYGRSVSRTRTREASAGRNNNNRGRPNNNRGRPGRSGFITGCTNCGTSHPLNGCPAYGKVCNNCKRLNHFAKKCRSKYIKAVENESETFVSELDNYNSSMSSLFIEAINTKPNNLSWQIPVRINNISFSYKIDTGAQCNVMPIAHFKMLNLPMHVLVPPSVNLWSYTGNRLDVIGSCRLDCIIKSVRCNVEFFVVDSNTQAILGLPACIKLNLITRVDSLNINHSEYRSLIQEYNPVFTGIGCIKERYHIELVNNAVPVISPVRKVPLPLMDKLKEAVDDLVSQKILEKVEGPSDWVNPLVIVKKPNNQLRLCMDPKYLNLAIKREHCVIPTFEEISAKLTGAKLFSTLDAANGFYQIQLDEESSKLCTMGTPFGRYKFLRLPYGIKCAPEVFSDRFSKIFQIPGVAIYIDDILVFGKSKTEHDERLRQVLNIAKSNGVTFNLSKCKFAQTEIKYMGYTISDKGVSPNFETIKAVKEMQTPSCKEDLQRILGVLNYVSKFIPNFSDNTAPLRQLLKKDSLFRWDPEHEEAFNKLKVKLTSRPVLQFYDVNQDAVLSVDSSMSGTGAVLLQNNLPVAYASKALTETQKRYAQIEKELLAICFGLQKFHNYVYGKSNVIVETDHLPLLGVFKKSLNQCPARLQRMLIQIQKYDFKLIHKRGKDLVIADTLSRAYLPLNGRDNDWDLELHSHVNLITSQININDKCLTELREETAKDSELQELIKIINNGWPNNSKNIKNSLKIYSKYKSDLTIIEGIIYKDQRCLIPKNMRTKILDKIHYTHLGLNKCIKLAEESVFWPTMKNEIKTTVENCVLCQKFSNSQPAEPLHPHEIIKIPWYKVGCDLFEIDNQKYLLVVDYYSKYVEMEALGINTTSNRIISVLKSMFARHGIPNILISDGGPQFSSEQFEQFSQEWNFTHNFSSPRYPQSNGMAERYIQTIKNMLRKVLADNKDINLALLHYRNTPIINGCSPFQLLMSRTARTNFPINPNNLHPKIVKVKEYNSYLRKKQSYQKQYYNYRKGAKGLSLIAPGTKVLVQTFPKATWIPGIILSKVGFRRYKIKMNNGAILERNRRFIKLLHESEKNAVPEMREIPDTHDNVKTLNNKEALHKKVSFGPVTYLNNDNTNFNLYNGVATRQATKGEQQTVVSRDSAPEVRKLCVSDRSEMLTSRSGRQLKPPKRLNL